MIYVTLYEVIAIVLAALGMVLAGHEPGAAGSVSVMASALAVVWNLVWNFLFERWEARQADRRRTFIRRAIHAIGFEGGLLIAFVPLMAWALHISLLEAFWLDIGLLVFFLVYTFVFNLVFDRIFGLPASAVPTEEGTP